MLKYDVLCVGSATVDHFLTIKVPLSSVKVGDKVLVDLKEIHTGGGATNSAAALANLGLKVKVLTKLGDDHDAKLILHELKSYKVSNICLNYSKKSTDSATIISSSKEKDRIIYVDKGASLDLKVTDFKKKQLNTKWVYLASLIGDSFETAIDLVQMIKKSDTRVIFNPSLYLAKLGKTELKPILQNTSILILNKEEAQALLKVETPSFKRLLTSLQKLGPKVVVITNGHEVFYAIDPKKKVYAITPPEVPRIHTAGAGDAFAASFLAGVINGETFENSLRLGQLNASSVIQKIGTKNGLLTLNGVKKMAKNNKVKIEVS